MDTELQGFYFCMLQHIFKFGLKPKNFDQEIAKNDDAMQMFSMGEGGYFKCELRTMFQAL